LLHNPKQSEFVVVTIPTEVAVAETQRLLTALETEEIAVRRVIINQILPALTSVEGNGKKNIRIGIIFDFFRVIFMFFM